MEETRLIEAPEADEKMRQLRRLLEEADELCHDQIFRNLYRMRELRAGVAQALEMTMRHEHGCERWIGPEAPDDVEGEP